MIYILHGDDLSSARNFILSLQSQNNINVRKEFSIENITVEKISEMLDSIDMFGEKQLYVFDVTGAGRLKLDGHVDRISKAPQETLVVILSGKELTKTNIFMKNVSALGARIMLFKKTQQSNMFKFVDAVFDKNRKESYRQLQRLIVTEEDPFYIFSMLLYGLRNVAYIKFNSSLGNKMAPFIKTNTKRRAQSFSEGAIFELYKDLYLLDKNVKTGVIPPDMLIPMTVEKVLAYS